MIEALTDPGEQLIWSGNPDPARYALRRGALPVPIGVSLIGIFLFWIYTMPELSPADIPFELPLWAFGAPILLAGAFFVLSPAWHFFRGMRTTYALTDRRAVVDVSGLFRRRMSVPLSQISFVDVQSSGEGPGHVLFQEAGQSSSPSPTRRKSATC
jgi:hypothetical protein